VKTEFDGNLLFGLIIFGSVFFCVTRSSSRVLDDERILFSGMISGIPFSCRSQALASPATWILGSQNKEAVVALAAGRDQGRFCAEPVKLSLR
jgi:hypothetical protein